MQLKMSVFYMAAWSILQIFGIFCSHLVHFMVIWYSFPVLVRCTKKNLANLTEVLNFRPFDCSLF
jgi:hypothetical protein